MLEFEIPSASLMNKLFIVRQFQRTYTRRVWKDSSGAQTSAVFDQQLFVTEMTIVETRAMRRIVVSVYS